MAASVRMRNTLTLFSSNDDVLCHRVRLVLAAKGVTFDLVPVDAQNPPEDLIHLNPYHSVPTLVERELVLYAASVVSEYLDERYPHPPLMPVDPLSRARLRLAMLRIEHDWVPQVQAIRDILDAGATCSVTQVEELAGVLNGLKTPPKLVVTDSQAFGKVKQIVPESIKLTSFSILFARYKGVLETAVRGAAAIENLKAGDRILISEGCTHHRQCGDIGTVKLPAWMFLLR